MEAVRNAIIHRVLTRHVDLLETYGLDLVESAVDFQVDLVGEVEEIGTSDVSCWINSVEERCRSHQIVYV
jgi:hypothetical protein